MPGSWKMLWVPVNSPASWLDSVSGFISESCQVLPLFSGSLCLMAGLGRKRDRFYLQQSSRYWLRGIFYLVIVCVGVCVCRPKVNSLFILYLTLIYYIFYLFVCVHVFVCIFVCLRTHYFILVYSLGPNPSWEERQGKATHSVIS